MSITNQIKKQILNMEDGSVIMTHDFCDITTITTIRKCLSRFTSEGLINRVFDGVYVKPKYSELLKEVLPADPDKIAEALARNYHWTIAPCGDIVLNKLGLSTQVPSVYSYISDGPYREFRFNNIKLVFKHRTNREITSLSRETIYLIEAIRALGKENVDDRVINHLKTIFSQKDRKKAKIEAIKTSEWIYKFIRKVCND